MHRLPSSGQSSPQSPPSSPPLSRSPRYRPRSSKSARPPPKTLAQRLLWIFLSCLLKRQGILIFAPILYIAVMLFYMGTVSFDVVPVITHRPPPGSVYRSRQLYHKLLPQMDSDNSSADAFSIFYFSHAEYRYQLYGNILIKLVNGDHVSTSLLKDLEVQLRISEIYNKSLATAGLPESNGYIFVEANGGLNQQRTSICNAVAVAGYLNATLVIPNFHYHSIWRDPRHGKGPTLGDVLAHGFSIPSSIKELISGLNYCVVKIFSTKFGDIYDEEFFIKTLENDVRIVGTIPGNIMERFDHNMSNVYNFKIKAWSPIKYYTDIVLPKLLEEKTIRISPFANRLSFDAPPAVQRLRCLANYQALRFSDPISSLGQTLVTRMKKLSVNNGGKYISVHLRFEEVS
ncbi:hypothetical protein SASPL_133140 [Salvia splendens]|uniref:O-fucosyltransferase family protein n=1 Tax=Salvia splendens TaxID=180675 RepID=A0A8X8X2E0_SALSN|nr:hypothetical protein SASPL_133140 [Salvia splendens]